MFPSYRGRMRLSHVAACQGRLYYDEISWWFLGRSPAPARTGTQNITPEACLSHTPLVVHDAAARPVVLSLIVTPKMLPPVGGELKITGRAKRASTCRITATPRTVGLPQTVRCSSGRFTMTLALSKNATLNVERIRISVTAIGPTGRSSPKSVIVQEAANVGALGATLDVHDFNGNELAVTVTGIVDPAAGANEFEQPPVGSRFVAINETLAAVGLSQSRRDIVYR